MALLERLLHRVHAAIFLADALDRGDRSTLGLNCQHIASLYSSAIKMDGARTALAGVATHVGTSKGQSLPDEIDQQLA